MKVKWIFFDLGNTLINEERQQEERVNQMVKLFSNRGINITRERIIEELENASREFSSRIIKEAVVNLSTNQEIEQYILNNLKYKKELEKPYLNADKILNYLYHKYRIGIIANQSMGSKDRLKRYGLWKYVSLLFASAELGLEKPDPKIFELALKKAECVPERAVMIGDRLDNDIGPSKKIGMNTIRMIKGFHQVQKPSNKFEKADYVIKELIELKNIL